MMQCYTLPHLNIGGLREGLPEPRSPFFSCILNTFLYDPNPSNRPLSVVIILQSGFNFIQFRPPLSEFSGSAPVKLSVLFYFILSSKRQLHKLATAAYVPRLEFLSVTWTLRQSTTWRKTAAMSGVKLFEG